jgi:hypothetical protein
MRRDIRVRRRGIVLAVGTTVAGLAMSGAAVAAPCESGCTQDATQVNAAEINQNPAADNTAVVQQDNQSVQQVSDKNKATNVLKQKVVYKDGEVVKVKTTEKTMTKTAGEAPVKSRTTTVCTSDCSQQAAQVNSAQVDQPGTGTNIATVQQANQNIQQIGDKNKAKNVLKQTVVYKGTPPADADVVTVQQGNQNIQQIGDKNKATSVVQQTVKQKP